jgi:hypothetical protein
MRIFGGIVRRRFERKVSDAVFVNLSRLASQWEEAANAALTGLEKEALRRLDRLVQTIERMVASTAETAPGIREDLARLERLRGAVARDRSGGSAAEANRRGEVEARWIPPAR